MGLKKELIQELYSYMEEESKYYTPSIEEFHVGFVKNKSELKRVLKQIGI